MDGGAAKRIAVLSISQPGARTIEVGAGTGALTRALLDCGARTTAIEIDGDLARILRERADLAAAEIVHADALEFAYDDVTGTEPWIATGNLPYNVATPLIVKWLGLRNPPLRVVAMVQRDVADRMAARPSTPSYGSLTLFVNYWTTVHRAFNLSPSAFYPRPGVNSSVVVLERRESPAVALRDVPFFLQVVRAAFAYRRKTLANSLSLALGIDRATTQAALGALDIDTEIRAEQLDLAAMGALADRLAP